MTPKSRWGTPPGLVFGANMGAFGTILVKIFDHFWTSNWDLFGSLFSRFYRRFWIDQGKRGGGLAACGALNIYIYIYIYES